MIHVLWYPIVLIPMIFVGAGYDDDQLPQGTPAEQVAAIKKKLDTARSNYVRKFEKASTTEERNQLMKEVPQPEQYAKLMMHVAEKHPNDPSALDALLWVMGNTQSGDKGSLNFKAKETIVSRYATSDRLGPFAVALSWSVSSADESMLRQLLTQNKVDQVKATLSYALAVQLIAQADMIDLYHVRLEVASDENAANLIRQSLDKDFGSETANMLRAKQVKTLREEAEQLLNSLIVNKALSAASWPTGQNSKLLGKLASRERDALNLLSSGKAAPDTEGTDVNGGKVTLSSHKGKVVLLTFSGHWCVACRNLYPLERELTKKHEGKPFTVLGVNSDVSRDLVKKVIEKEKMFWQIIWDGGTTEGPLAQQWNVKGWPLVVLIDHQGLIRYRFNGAPVSAILTPLVDRLVKEAEQAR